MGELVKAWNDGGSLSISYNGNGDGTAIFSSSENTGEARTMDVSFVDASRSVIVVRTVRQAAADVPADTYTPLTFIEATGAQYIDLGYVVKDDDVIEANYVLTKIDATDKFLFGTSDGTTGLWFEYYGSNAYARFGHNSSYSSSNRSGEYKVVLQKNNIVLGETSASLDYTAMPNTPLFLFAGASASGNPYAYGYYRCSLFRISDSNGVVMELLPHRRDSDGAVGLLDTVSGQFYVSQGEAFVEGGVLAEGYELIEYVTFDGDKIYDTGRYGNNQTSIDVLFKRTDTSGAHYLFGCSSGNRLTSYLTSSGYWRYGNAYPQFNTNNQNLTRAMVTPGKTTVGTTTRTFNVNEFTTPYTIPVGGVKPSTGVATPQFKGYLYYFTMRIADEIVVDWAPVRRVSDGVEGFWDAVSNVFVESII